MLEHTPEAAAAIESREREFTHLLLVDWNRDGNYDHPLSDLSRWVKSTSREGAVSSTAPEEAMLVEGHAAVEFTAILAGNYDGYPLAAQFSPSNGRSEFYAEGLPLGTTFYYELSVWTTSGWEAFRQITGVVREPRIDRATGEVILDCLDNVEKARTPVDIPPYGLWQHYLADGYKRAMLVDSSSLIDLAARAGGFNMGPDPFVRYPSRWDDDGSTPATILSVPLHGSILPEIGTLDNAQGFHLTEKWENGTAEEQAYAEGYREGPHGYLARNRAPDTAEAADHDFAIWWVDDTNASAGYLESTWALGAWVYYDGDRVNIDYATPVRIRVRGNEMRLVIDCAAGRAYCELKEHSGGPLLVGPSLDFPNHGWHYIEAVFDIADAAENGKTWVRATMRVNDTVTGYSQIADYYPGDVNDPLSGLVRSQNTYAISDITVFEVNHYEALGGLSRDLTPLDNAQISKGRNRITYTTRETGREAWELAKEVAAAEFGVVMFDEHGRFVFWNYDDVVERQQTPVRTFTVDDLSSLGLRATVDSIRNVWSVTTKAGRARPGIAYDLGDDGVPLYEVNGELLPAELILPTQSAAEYFVPVDDHVISVEPYDMTPDYYYTPSVGWSTHGPRRGSITWDADTGTYLDQGPHTEQKFVTRDRFRLWLDNGWPDHRVTFYSPSNEPRLRVQGTIVAEDLERTWTVRDQDSIDRYGERVIELDGKWLQDEWQTRAMLSKLIARMGRPISITEKLTVPGDPRIQIGDTIEVRDAEGFGESMLMQIYGIRREFSAVEGLVDTYTVEMVTPPGQGIWDSQTYGLWDQSFIWT